MQTLHQIQQVRACVKQWREQQHRIALITTMGNLHDGHLALVNKGKSLADRVVVTIFVNPLQFDNADDLKNYPRTLQEDLAKLADCGVHMVFNPEVGELYPIPLDQQTKVIVPDLSDRYCGASRPGHFIGVATVVTKFFNIVQPDVSIWGEKDFQQVKIIQHMVNDLCMPIEIISLPTVREPDGLAMSSRNSRLTATEREIVPHFHRILKETAELIRKGNKDFTYLTQHAATLLVDNGFRNDYIAICNAETLLPATVNDRDLVILGAVFLGKTRLIDNVRVALKKTTK